MRKIGITGYAFEHTDENFEKVRASGLSAIELTLHHEPFMDFKKEAEMAKRHDITLWSCHIPFRPYDERDVSLEDPTARKKFIEYISERIKSGSEVGIDKYVIHPSIPIPEERREERKKCAMDSFAKLAEIAASCGAVIAVEDMISSCLGNSADELLEIISVDDRLRICFDVNHLFNDTHVDFAKKVKGKIATVHISDYDFIQERHLCPGLGKINWPELYKAICDTGYDGVWMYEMHLKQPGIELTYDDIYNLTLDIFAGKQPEILPNL